MLCTEEPRNHPRFNWPSGGQFISPPEAIVGERLFGYANLLMMTETMENAAAVCEFALLLRPLPNLIANSLALAPQDTHLVTNLVTIAALTNAPITAVELLS